MLTAQSYWPRICCRLQQKRLCVLAVLSLGQGSIWEKYLETRIKILALVPPREVCQPLYFMSRAQTVIKIRSDIINTRKGQGWAGYGIRRTQPHWGWPWVSSDFQWGAGGLSQTQAHSTPSQRMKVHLALLLLLKEEKCHFLSSGSSWLISEVGMWLFCNFSANIHRKRRGAAGRRCEYLLSSYSVHVFPGVDRTFPYPRPMASAPESQVSHMASKWQRWDFVPGQQNSKACLFFFFPLKATHHNS